MESRPKAMNVSRSFTRMDSAPVSPLRKRASTTQEASTHAIPEVKEIRTSRDLEGNPAVADIFENREDEDDNGGKETETNTSGPDLQLPSTFDELPIEIRSLTERFLESLSAKVHPQPLSASDLSEIFQDFYERAASHISTHIATLTARIGRDKSPVSATTGFRSIGRSRAGSGAKRSDSSTSVAGGEMLTATEVADRKKARRLLELQRVALEEAVERAVTEKVYERIWKHKSTDDDARDEKLRSRTAALSLVGIGLRELHMDSDPRKEDVRKATQEKEEEIHQSLATAREALQKMNDEHFPLGKLRHLTEAHKSIVETLSQLFPSTSSADEILPTLIYTLITSPHEGINAVSNLNFIQRFRTASKIDGEAAYCLVNFEAAISFLETVDLSSLRASELPEGPPKTASQPSTPISENPPSLAPVKPSQPQTAVSEVAVHSRDTSNSSNLNDPLKPSSSPKTSTTPTRPPLHQRRISSLMQAQADRIEASRDNLLNVADKFYESINGTLDNSFQFVFGRFKDQNQDNSALPKTLEDARKLVSSPDPVDEEDLLSSSGRSSPGPEDALTTTSNKVVELVGGRRQIRDHSVDSARSGGSGGGSSTTGRRAGAGNDALSLKARTRENTASAPPSATAITAAAASGATMPSNLFTTINPLKSFNVPNFRPFGRSTSVPVVASPSPSIEKSNKLAEIVEASPPLPASSMDQPQQLTQGGVGSTIASAESSAREALAELRRTKPPKKRFLEVQSVADLRIGEVEELLMEYRRLAGAVRKAVQM